MQAGSRLRASAGETKGRLVHWNEMQRPRGKRSQFERRMEQKKNTRREKTHQQTHINQKSVSPQLQKLTDSCSCDRPGRKRQAERDRSVGKRNWKWNQGIRIILKVNSIAKTLEGAK